MAIAKRDPRVLMAPDYVAQRRHTRRPQHTFNLKLSPYQIQPFLLAPVLPGETFQSMMLQSQTWSDPLKASMKNIGWWLQYNFFYVRHRDLPSEVRVALAQMMLDPDTDISDLKTVAASPALYTYAGAMDWTNMCLEHIVSEYFRDEGEDVTEAMGFGLPLCQIHGKGTSNGWDKLTLETEYEDRRLDLIDAEGHLYANDLTTMLGHYNAMRDAGLTEMDYADFMKTYGSTVREDEESPNLHRAEDLWALREFTYPTNTVEPTTGVPAVAAGWRVQKSGGKRVFCDEPGFIFGVTYARPKVYLKNQLGSMAGMMDSVTTWLPAVLHGKADLGHRLHPHDEGPAASKVGNDGYYVDIRDLLLYGDQFVNHDLTQLAAGVELPSTDARRKYAAESEIRSFFTDTTNGRFEMDGIASLSILGRQRESTRANTLSLA